MKIYGTAEDMMSAIRYVAPPNYGAAFINFTDAFAHNVLSDSGANDAALGNMRPDNATAIVQAREAAMAPMQMYQNRFYSANEDVARIWADFWITMYGKRSIKINNGGNTQYIVFDAERYKELVITARIDVGASTLWSEAVCITNLNGLLQSGQIDFIEYLERLPKGLIPNIGGLINSRKTQAKMQQQTGMQQQIDSQSVSYGDIGNDEVIAYLKQINPKAYEQFMKLSPEQQQLAFNMMRKGNTGLEQLPTPDYVNLQQESDPNIEGDL